MLSILLAGLSGLSDSLGTVLATLTSAFVSIVISLIVKRSQPLRRAIPSDVQKGASGKRFFSRLACNPPPKSTSTHAHVFNALLFTEMDFFFTITAAVAPAPSKVEEVDELPQVNEDSGTGSSGSCVIA
ncbi:hypothetical protein DFH08DRAFT_953992 [Mycena albidolilacea]|uniref:Uncharacterized protein n=1 Tax=Mycena albidolilacea TaxID=1033008 RepID=A0AAD7EZN7_9AGAR|nr:hypothetical protein DFH08DRAFT_953992 [Mycena albidolilacea]